MNSRIRELVLESTIKVNRPSLDSNGEVVCDNWEECVSLEKFAELIVRECSEFTHPVTRKFIFEHFGVEE